MTKKTDLVRKAIKEGNLKEALKLAKGFRINVTREQRDIMAKAYECIVHPDFYRQIGVDIPQTIESGRMIVCALYG